MNYVYNKEKEVLTLTNPELENGFRGCPWNRIRDLMSRPCHKCSFPYRAGGCPDYIKMMGQLDEYLYK